MTTLLAKISSCKGLVGKQSHNGYMGLVLRQSNDGYKGLVGKQSNYGYKGLVGEQSDDGLHKFVIHGSEWDRFFLQDADIAAKYFKDQEALKAAAEASAGEKKPTLDFVDEGQEAWKKQKESERSQQEVRHASYLSKQAQCKYLNFSEG